jgi:NADH-quinone oxidoreductase subunit A
MITDFSRVFLFFVLGTVFVAGGLVTAWLVRPSRGYPAKLTSYECGEEPVGDSWVRFNIRFYVVALIFLIFDVEIVFLVPWAVVYGRLGGYAFVEMTIFLAILLVGYAYVWVKGDLDWDKPLPNIPVMKRAAPAEKKSISEEVTV